MTQMDNICVTGQYQGQTGKHELAQILRRLYSEVQPWEY